MLENVGRLIVEHDDGTRVVAENVDRLTIDAAADPAEAVRNGSRTSAAQAEERGFDSRPPLQPIAAPTFGGSAAGAHGNHRRYGRSDPACTFCVAATRSEPRSDRSEASEAPIRAQVAATRSDRSEPIDRSNDSSSIDRLPSDLPSSVAATALIDLDRPDVLVLKRKWGRGGRSTREPHLKPADLARLDAIAECPCTGTDAGSGRRWSASVLDNARGDLLRELERQHHELHRPAVPDPSVVVEASTRRRDAVMAGYRDLVERGEATDVVRSIYERMTHEQGQAQGP